MKTLSVFGDMLGVLGDMLGVLGDMLSVLGAMLSVLGAMLSVLGDILVVLDDSLVVLDDIAQGFKESPDVAEEDHVCLIIKLEDDDAIIHVDNNEKSPVSSEKVCYHPGYFVGDSHSWR